MTDSLHPNSRPELTMPEAEAGALRAAYDSAEVILEYGSGGSTVLAGELGKTVWSVESDQDWAAMMQGWFDANPTKGRVQMVPVDIGETREWGQPVDDSGWKSYARYPLSVWDMDGFTQPDVVLVDGRFRVGCALATAYRTQKPVTLLFDDYKHRERLHVVERFIGQPLRFFGRMAQFEINPTPLPADRLLRVIQLMQRP